MRKYIWKPKIYNQYDWPKTMLHNYFLCKGEPSYIAIFPAYIRTDSDIQICNITPISEPSLGILDQLFCVSCIGSCIDVFKYIVHRPPL